MMAPVSPKAHAQGSTEPPRDKDAVRLYGMRFCPYVHRVRLVLEAKNIAYETVNIHLQNKPDWYLAKLPEGKVPLLEWNDNKKLAESLVIADYLDEKYPEPRLWSQDPYLKARGRMIIELTSKVNVHLTKIRESQEPSAYEGVRTEMAKLDKILETCNNPFFSGQKVGMVDFMIWPIVVFAKMFFQVIPSPGQEHVFSRELVPNLVSWGSRMKQDPIVEKCDVGEELLAEYFKGYFAGSPNFNLGL